MAVELNYVKRPRRLIVRDVSGKQLLTDNFGHPLRHFEIELTGVANANATCAMEAVVQEQCSLGHWHDQDRTTVPCWGAD